MRARGYPATALRASSPQGRAGGCAPLRELEGQPRAGATPRREAVLRRRPTTHIALAPA
ncbi:MAG: hypothetical protein JWL77_7098, partial [Chthonomonadaceae bacterium]|nr:hypothetical protein [Chthonomonadaceae bacterium]